MSAPIGIFGLVFALTNIQTLASTIAQLILTYWKRDSEDEYSKRRELTELRKELNLIRAMDEFAKYARTQRKINKLTDDLSNINKTKSMASMKYRWIATALLYTLQVIVYLFLIWTYRSHPVISLDPDWLFPLATFVSIPTGVPGAVGITCWLLVCNRVSSLLVDAVRKMAAVL